MQIHGRVDAGCSQAVCKIYVPDGNVPSSPSQVPIPNLSRGENLALQHRRIIGAVRTSVQHRAPYPSPPQVFCSVSLQSVLQRRWWWGRVLTPGAMIQPGRFLYINTQSHCRRIICHKNYYVLQYHLCLPDVIVLY